MTFRIEKVTYGSGKVRYYPMIKRRFFRGWLYMYQGLGPKIEHFEFGNKIYFAEEYEAKYFIGIYENNIHKEKKIFIEHITID